VFEQRFFERCKRVTAQNVNRELIPSGMKLGKEINSRRLHWEDVADIGADLPRV
jgi:hypothetical protein